MSSDHIDQPAAISDPLMVMLAPEDADTAFAAGVQFVHALAGAESTAFLMALGEQQALIHAAVLEAGYPDGKARAAGEAFEAGARRMVADRQPGAAGGMELSVT